MLIYIYFSFLNKQLDKELNNTDVEFVNNDQLVYGKDVGIVSFIKKYNHNIFSLPLIYGKIL